jgi:TetR/AcrR family transcriptional repressor of nem operon
MGITGASLYNTFGDKRTLYLRALDRYLSQSVRERIARLEGNLPPHQAIAAFLREVVERSLRDKQHRGCLLVNCALEVAPHDQALRGAVAAELGEIEGFFRRCARAGQQAGTITGACSAEDAATLLLGVLLGIRVLARTRPQRRVLEGVMKPMLALLRNPAPMDRQPQ